MTSQNTRDRRGLDYSFTTRVRCLQTNYLSIGKSLLSQPKLSRAACPQKSRTIGYTRKRKTEQTAGKRTWAHPLSCRYSDSPGKKSGVHGGGERENVHGESRAGIDIWYSGSQRCRLVFFVSLKFYSLLQAPSYDKVVCFCIERSERWS